MTIPEQAAPHDTAPIAQDGEQYPLLWVRLREFYDNLGQEIQKQRDPVRMEMRARVRDLLNGHHDLRSMK